jgi:hypothetical protein
MNVSLDIHHLAEMLSLVMTVPTVILAFAVVYLWLPAARAAANTPERDANQWFILGVVGGFIGAAMDNLYWFLPWSASFVGETKAFEELTSLGVYFNVIFRQGLGIFAAWCHIRAAEMSSIKGVRFVNKLIVFSYVIGILYVTVISARSA